MDLITFLICSLAVARVTKLITTDRILAAPRRWALIRLDSDGLTAYLLVCNWCVSVYVGAAAAVGGAATGAWSWGWALPLALSFSYVAGYLASREGE